MPLVPFYSERALRPEDAGALRAMAAACEQVDGRGSTGPIFRWAERCEAGDAGDAGTMAVWDAGGAIAAFGAVACDETPHELRLVLDGRTHPDHRRRGLGSAIFGWSEHRAQEILAARPAVRPAVLRVDSTGVTDDAARLYTRHGFQFAFAEDLMQHNLGQTIPAVALPPGLALATWSDEIVPAFYAAYTAAFRERPGFPGWSQGQWAAWIGDDEDFSPLASFVALAGERPAGFIVAAVDAPKTPAAQRSGWIVQVGSVPEWRGEHVGAALVCRVLQLFREQGLDRARLHVNANNPRAAEVYRRLGFTTVQRRSVYQKALG